MLESIIIEIIDPLDFSKSLELNFNDFIALNVNTLSLDESNSFLNSIWREFNMKFSPQKLDRCPWAYFPQRLTTKKSSILYFGSMRTKLGIIHVAISYKVKGRINSIYFYSQDFNVAEKSNKTLFKNIVRKAKKNMCKKFEYTVRCNLVGKYESENNIGILSNYTTDKFRTFVDKNDKSYIEFIVYGYDLTDAYKNSNEKIKLLVNFLAVETNIYFQYYDISIFENKDEQSEKRSNYKNTYQEDIYIKELECDGSKFIDLCPKVDDKIFLSQKGIEFIGKIIASEQEDYKINMFLNSCYHFRQGLEKEYNLDTNFYGLNTKSVVKSSKINQPNAGSLIDGAVTYYLSALETVTLIDYNPEKCEACGQLKFQINMRVCTFINENLWENYGEIFKKLYDLRSKYLHTGEAYTSSVDSYIRPLLDDKTATGCKDYDFITLNIKGNTIGIAVTNIRECTSYALRNFYKQLF